ncbi:hypothetical protein [Streptomyces salinarius]|uniref:Transposase n=1 Tax=Streptomyces salinarius TaxID=2762598 RepID=A0ABW8BLW9_9ACTN
MRPFKQRDEMWLATRALLQPDPGTGVGRLRLRTDRNAAIQLTGICFTVPSQWKG